MGGKGSGGSRKGAGAKPKAFKDQQVLESPGFATTVLGRIGEGKPKEIKTAEDYALDLLFSADMQTRSVNFNRLLDRKHGTPPKGRFAGDAGEKPALKRGNVPSYFGSSAHATRNPAGSDKPN